MLIVVGYFAAYLELGALVRIEPGIGCDAALETDAASSVAKSGMSSFRVYP